MVGDDEIDQGLKLAIPQPCINQFQYLNSGPIQRLEVAPEVCIAQVVRDQFNTLANNISVFNSLKHNTEHEPGQRLRIIRFL